MEGADHLERMRRIARRVNNIPTLPTTMAKMIEIVNNPKTTVASVDEVQRAAGFPPMLRQSE